MPMYKVARTDPKSGYGNRIWVDVDEMRRFPDLERKLKELSMWGGIDKSHANEVSWEFGHGSYTDTAISLLLKNGWKEETGEEESPAFKIVSYRLDRDLDIHDVRSFACQAMANPNGKLVTVTVEYDGDEVEGVVLFLGEATTEEITSTLAETLKEQAAQNG